MAEAMRCCPAPRRRIRRRPLAVGRDDEALRRVGVFVELHVEQGRELVDLDRPVGGGLVDLAARPVAL